MEMKHPIVSIIIPTYNREKLILKALESVFKQSFQDFEILIIDDASTDNTESVIGELNHPQIRYFKLDKNGGQCIARNFGTKQAHGTYVAFLDSDDEWLPEKLEKQVDCFDQGTDRLGAVYGYSYSKDVKKDQTVLIDSGYFRGDIHEQFLLGFCPPTPSLFMVRKTALERVGGFDESLVTFVDLDLWMRISEYYEFDYVEVPIIIKYEQIGDQYVNNFEKRYRGYKLFIDKWESRVEEELGHEGLMHLKRHLIRSLVIPLLDHPPVNIRRNSLKLVGLMMSIRARWFRLYLKAIMIWVFGPGIIYRIRKYKS